MKKMELTQKNLEEIMNSESQLEVFTISNEDIELNVCVTPHKPSGTYNVGAYLSPQVDVANAQNSVDRGKKSISAREEVVKQVYDVLGEYFSEDSFRRFVPCLGMYNTDSGYYKISTENDALELLKEEISIAKLIGCIAYDVVNAVGFERQTNEYKLLESIKKTIQNDQNLRNKYRDTFLSDEIDPLKPLQELDKKFKF